MNKNVERFLVVILFLIIIFIIYLLTEYMVDNHNYNLNKSYKVTLSED